MTDIKDYTMDDEAATWDDGLLWVEGTFDGRDAFFGFEPTAADTAPITVINSSEIDDIQVLPGKITAGLRLELAKIEFLEANDD
jgi:hypothetical protein